MRKFLLATDGSESALRSASYLAGLYQDTAYAEVMVLHISPSISPIYTEEIHDRAIRKKYEAWKRRKEEEAREYLKSHGLHARDVMTRQVLTVEEDASLQDIATLLEKHRIKRVPVVRAGKVVGIVSRANLLQALVAQSKPPAPQADDRALRKAVMVSLNAASRNNARMKRSIRSA